jgi:hypothetical protein
VLSIVAIEKNILMHNVVLLATFNLLLHRRNKKKRQDIENNVLNAIQEPLIRNMFTGDSNEQDTEKAELIQ